MASLSTNSVLNRVLIVHNRSLPVYLMDAAPWLKPGDERTSETLELIARDHKQVVERIGALMSEENAAWDMGEFPMTFTGYHDVSFEFLLPLLIERQRKTVAYLQKCADELSLAPLAQAMVEETVGMAKGHLEMLEELQRPAPLAIVPTTNGSSAAAHAPVAH